VDSEKLFPVVGIGSSAGGVEALRAFFDRMPPTTGMAFVLVSHLPPDHDSLLTDILRRHTVMQVHTAKGGQRIEPNAIYVCPPNQILTVDEGALHLMPQPAERQRKPIDVFLASLAAACAQASVGVVLSGSDSDGALGIKAIKEAGGLTLAQGSDGSKPLYSDMPNAAIAGGVVDIIASIEEMPSRLANYAQHFGELEAKVSDDSEKIGAGMANGYQPIYRILLNQVGHDFSGYKDKTFARRVRRRMQVLQLQQLEDYVARLRKDPEEVSLLFRDLLISVTSFFRDPEAFDVLGKSVIPAMLKDKGAADTIRVWVPGCATGEEVYSIAILLREHMDAMRTPPKLQIFATDIDEPALGIARAGRYPEQAVENVSADHLKKYFVVDDVSYVVGKSIRDLCLFSSHSVVRDPPFSRVDLISCRNLLIYLGPDFQGQVIPVFHFALRPGGYLFLGTSENVTRHGDLFAPMEKKQRIFQRRDHPVTPLRLPFLTPHGRNFPPIRDIRQDPAAALATLRRSVETRVMERFAPAHVVVNSEGDILHFSARTGKYLEPASGTPNRQLLSMARRGLRLDLRAALREAVETRRRVERQNIEAEYEDRPFLVDLTIEPLGVEPDPLFLVLFDDAAKPQHAVESGKLAGGDHKHYEQIEQELRDTRDRLQATVEEYETAVEEMKSSNEELQSINEELQSTNEELETSKEELQSVNEELHTVNAELNSKVVEVDRAHTDLRNVFDSTQIATVFLDKNLVIRSFTPAVTQIFNLISGDRGRPLSDIVSRLETKDLARDVQTVFKRGEVVERNVRRIDGEAEYLMRILPYRNLKQVIDGVLVTFNDVSKMAEAEASQLAMADELNNRVQSMLDTVNEVAKRSLTKNITPEAFAEDFSHRIKAITTAYNFVSRASWRPVPLREVINAQIGGSSRSKHIEIEGPDITAKPKAALALGLVVYELCTNAVKHGSLSRPNGRVKIHWSIEQRRKITVVIRWSEVGGPPAKKPAGNGAGATLIDGEVTDTLKGRVSLGFTEKGLEAEIAIPFEENFRAEK
jgi:two-component system CheB/CheR fusion protein